MEQAYEEILDRYKDPQNQGTIDNPDISIKDSNPLCGDEIEIHAKLDDHIIQDIKFTSIGCAISKASLDMLLDYVINKNVNEVLEISNEEMLGLLGISVSPMRLKCALLGLVALKKGIKEFKNDIRN